MKTKSVVEMVMGYRKMERTVPHGSMLREVKLQYAEMAEGGDGGPGNGKRSIREEYYLGKPDGFFQEVRNLMGWK